MCSQLSGDQLPGLVRAQSIPETQPPATSAPTTPRTVLAGPRALATVATATAAPGVAAILSASPDPDNAAFVSSFTIPHFLPGFGFGMGQEQAGIGAFLAVRAPTPRTYNFRCSGR